MEEGGGRREMFTKEKKSEPDLEDVEGLRLSAGRSHAQSSQE